MSLYIDLIETSPHSVFDANITHNLGKMAKRAGIYTALWHPEEAGIKNASELAHILAPAIADMEARPILYKTLEPSNKWGTYDNFVPWLKKLYHACIMHPNAEIKVDI